MTENDSVDNFFDTQLYQWNKILFLICGRWPYQSRKWRVIILFTVMSEITVITLGQVIYFVEVFGDVDAMTKCLLGLTVSYCAYVSVINSIVNFAMMKEVLENVKYNWMQLKTEDEIAIFLRHTMEGKSFIRFIMGIAIASISAYTSRPFISELYYILIPINETHRLKPITDLQLYIDPSKYYILTYSLSALATIFIVAIVLTLDAYFLMTVHHACGMHAVLRFRIDMVGKECNKKTTKGFSIDDQKKFIFEKMIECVEYHHDCVRFSKLIENSSNVSFLMQITSSTLTISVSAVQTIIKSNEPEEMLTYGLITFIAVIRLFYISFASQSILDYSVQIHQSICDLSWYKLPQEAKKLLLLMLLSSSRPSSITIGKLMPLNLGSFSSLMRVSMSYVTFILSIHLSKNNKE